LVLLEGTPAFRWPDFLAGTDVDAADWEGVGFIFLGVFRVMVVCLIGGYFIQKLNGFNQSSPWSRDRFHDKVLFFVFLEHHHGFFETVCGVHH
jgi:hypothetical protein